MQLKKLKLKNIRSYESLELEFSEGSLLLAGDIGSGKSSILLAIEYALFGLQPGQKGLALLRNNSDSGYVFLEIEAKGKLIEIERKLKRTSKGVSNEYASVTIDGIKNESSVTEIKTIILNHLGYPPEFIKKNNLLYRYTVFTPQESMKQIILEDPETRLNIIRHIFGIDKYRRIRENLQVILTKIKQDSKILEVELIGLKESQALLKDKTELISKLSTDISEKSKELDLANKKRKSLELELKEIKEKAGEKDIIQREIDKIIILKNAKLDSLQEIKKQQSEISISLEKEKDQFDESKYNSILNELSKTFELEDQLNSKLIDISSNLSSIEKIKSDNLRKKERIFKIDICPTCLQDVPENHKHNILNDTETLISQIDSQSKSLMNEKDLVKKELSSLREKRSSLESERSRQEILKSKKDYIDHSKIKLEELSKTSKFLEEDTKFLSNHLISLKQSLLSYSKYENIIRKIESDISLAHREERDIEISIAELKKEQELTAILIEQTNNEIKQKETIKRKLSHLIEIQDWLENKFSSLIEFTERNVLMNIRIEFSRLFQKWFSFLVSSDSLDVELDESFSPIIIQAGVETEYSFLSGGERTAIALAYRLSLNQTINSLFSKIETRNIVILDEPTDGFSETQIDKMRDIFSELDISQLIVVSHEQKIESFVQNVIRIKKSGDSSYIENNSGILNTNSSSSLELNEDSNKESPKNLNTPNL